MIITNHEATDKDAQQRYETYRQQVSSYLAGRQSIEVQRLMANLQTAASLPPTLYAQLQHHVAVTLYTTHRFFEAEAFAGRLPPTQADEARVEAVLACSGKEAYSALILAAVANPVLRTQLTLGRRITRPSSGQAN